jgi:hypothetical protein
MWEAILPSLLLGTPSPSLWEPLLPSLWEPLSSQPLGTPLGSPLEEASPDKGSQRLRNAVPEPGCHIFPGSQPSGNLPSRPSGTAASQPLGAPLESPLGSVSRRGFPRAGEVGVHLGTPPSRALGNPLPGPVGSPPPPRDRGMELPPLGTIPRLIYIKSVSLVLLVVLVGASWHRSCVLLFLVV